MGGMECIQGMRALDVYTSVVDSLGRAGVFVILDNHIRYPSTTNRASWCRKR